MTNTSGLLLVPEGLADQRVNKSNVLPFRNIDLRARQKRCETHTAGRFDDETATRHAEAGSGVILQYDFELFFELAKRMRAAKAEWQTHRNYIVKCLRKKWKLESGVHVARIGRYRLRRKLCKKLIVR